MTKDCTHGHARLAQAKVEDCTHLVPLDGSSAVTTGRVSAVLKTTHPLCAKRVQLEAADRPKEVLIIHLSNR